MDSNGNGTTASTNKEAAPAITPVPTTKPEHIEAHQENAPQKMPATSPVPVPSPKSDPVSISQSPATASAGTGAATTASAAPSIASDLLQKIQPFLLIAGLTVATLYAVGYSVSYSASLELGVGGLAPAREVAIACGIGFFFYRAAAVCGAIILILSNSAAPKKEGNSSTNFLSSKYTRWLFIYLFSLIATCYVDINLHRVFYFRSGYRYFTHLFTDSLGVFMITAIWGSFLRDFVKSKVGIISIMSQWFAILVVSGVLNVVLFGVAGSTGAESAVRNTPLFGGYLLNRVEYRKDMDKPGKRGLLIMSTPDYLIIGNYKDEAEFWTAFDDRKKHPLDVVKIRSDKIESVINIDAGEQTEKQAATPSSHTTPAPAALYKK